MKEIKEGINYFVSGLILLAFSVTASVMAFTTSKENSNLFLIMVGVFSISLLLSSVLLKNGLEKILKVKR